MLQVIGYAIAVAMLLSVVGFGAEQLLARRKLPRRAAWMLAMVVSTLLPLVMLSRAEPVPVAVGIIQPIEAPATTPASAAASRSADVFAAAPAESLTRWIPPLPSDRAIFLLWISASSVLLLYVSAASLLLHRRASQWRRELVLGHEVLVSKDTGPALLGALRPRIVVPHWCLDEPAATRLLILQHEQQHIAGRDPLLLWTAVLVVVALPWNLPLWWQLRRLRLAIELDCDARVLRAGADVGSYGEVLLAVTRRAANLRGVAVAMGQPVSALEQRIRNLTRVSPRHAGLRTAGALLMAVAGVSAAAMLKAPIMPGGDMNAGSERAAVPPTVQQVPPVIAATERVLATGSAAPTIPAAPAAAAASTRPPPSPEQPPASTEMALLATGLYFSTSIESGVTQCWHCTVAVSGEAASDMKPRAERLEISDDGLVRAEDARIQFESGAEVSGESLTVTKRSNGSYELTGEDIRLVNIPPHLTRPGNVILEISTSVDGKEPESSEHIVTLGKEAVIYNGPAYRVAVVAQVLDRTRVNLAFTWSGADSVTAVSMPSPTMEVATGFGVGVSMSLDAKRPSPASLKLDVTPRLK